MSLVKSASKKKKRPTKKKTAPKNKLRPDDTNDGPISSRLKRKKRGFPDYKAMNSGTIIDNNVQDVTSKNQKLDLPAIEENKEMGKPDSQSAAATTPEAKKSKKKKPAKRKAPQSKKKKSAKRKAPQSKKKKSVKRKAPPYSDGQSKKITKIRAKPKTKVEKINDQLSAIGIDFGQYDHIGHCARAAIYKGFIKLTGDVSDLDQVLMSGELDCGHQCTVTLRNLLRQPDYAGLDYEDGLENATIFCDQNTEANDYEECYEGRTYVTRMCNGNPTFDSGKFHNHCVDCKNFGKCIGDYREAHCGMCGKHYFRGMSGFPCSCEEENEARNDECSIQ